MIYNVDGKITYKFRLKVNAASEIKAETMATVCAAAGSKPSIDKLLYIAVEHIEVDAKEEE